jgi:hypothetical protein
MTPVLHTVKGSVDTVAASVAMNLHRVQENLQTAKYAVTQDLRALWAAMDQLQGLPAANDVPESPRHAPAVGQERKWGVPVGWISLVVAGAIFAGLGLAHITVVEAARRESAGQKRSGSAKRQLKQVRPPSRTDWSREG